MSYQYLFTQTYTDSVRACGAEPKTAVALHDALARLGQDPFHDSSLQTHRVKGAKHKLYTSYVDQSHRLIWHEVNRTIVLLLFGDHDPVYRRAERLSLVLEPDGSARVWDEHPTTAEPVPYVERRAQEGALFMAWTDDELGGFGFEPQEVIVLRRLQTEAELLDLEARMRSDAFQTAFNLVAFGHPDGEAAALAAVAAEEPAPAFVLEAEQDAKAEQELERRLHDELSRGEFAPVAADALADALSRPIEDWMVFLHPDQSRLVERTFSGPARVSGAAGTGKTVVALHRAQRLARAGGCVLFTTYVKTLPPVWDQLHRRLGTEAPGSIEFVGLHKWATGHLTRHGQRPAIDPGQVDAAFAEALAHVERNHELPLTPKYYRDEIDWVLKGRVVPTLDAYRKLERTGRRTPLTAVHREAVWELAERYSHELDQRGVWDFNDVLLRCLELVRTEEPGSLYDHVVVDEAQDITGAGVRLLHALVGDRPDGLLLVGDGQQRIYPGGYTLAAAGVAVVGRAAQLRVNYRNTEPILRAAMSIVRDAAFEDAGEGEVRPGARHVTCSRPGDPVVCGGYASEDDHDQALLLAVEQACQQPGVTPGDLAILVPSNKAVEGYERRLRELGYPVVRLDKYDGRPTPRLKIGTYQRAKGLEFKEVFLPRLDGRALRDWKWHTETPEEHAERIELLRSQLFVAVTRARDRLWCGWVGQPSRVLGALQGDVHVLGQ